MSREGTGVASLWHVRVSPRSPQLDGHGRSVLGDVRQIGLQHIEGVRSSRLYFLGGRLTDADVRLLAEQLLADPVVETYRVGEGLSHRDDRNPAVEVHYQPGVMNPLAMSTLDAARDLLATGGHGEATLERVQTARRYEIVAARNLRDLEAIARNVLANDCIETWYFDGFGLRDPIPADFPAPPIKPFELRHVAIWAMDDALLEQLSREAHLFLSLEEMRTIRDHFASLRRDPTDLELETLAQTWSEHCVHKTLKCAIEYHGDDFGRDGAVELRLDNLLKETIVAATRKLDRDWCLSVFVDNAGVIAFDDEFGLAFKVETHNHPSAIEPYGGAATGVGGCIRDIMGCGLGAKPIASTDVFCLAPPDFDARRLPKEVLHPRRVLHGVVAGVRDYGNRMGIPTINGAIHFDERYLANPLVFCGCLGLIPRNRIAKGVRPEDLIIVAGGRTGRDGIHGATFSSAELTETHAHEFSHAVQIGHAIEEKKLLDAMLLARDHAEGCLYSSVTDCGAGGLSSAVGEMGAELGATVDLEKVPLKYSGLRYDEIWISEAQERMVFAVPPERIERFLQVFEEEEVEATVIGRFTADRVLCVRFNGQTVGRLNMDFLHKGLPKRTLKAHWHADCFSIERNPPLDGDPKTSANQRLLWALSRWTTASKEWVIRQYDHEVQGRSALKPLVGPGFGPSDAAVLRPRYDSYRGVGIACGLQPCEFDDDPYWMAVKVVDEALRNVICVGADPERVAILDNFCWPKVENEWSLGALVRTCRGAMDAALAYGLPFISGKDSLNNEFILSEEEARRTGLPRRLAIPYTLLISAVGIVEDVRRCVSMDLKETGHVLALATLPRGTLDLNAAADLHRRAAAAIRSGKVFAAHDVSDGGLGVALAEMCIASGLGANVRLPQDPYRLFLHGHFPPTYVLEMTERNAIEAGFSIIGRVTAEDRLRVDGWDAGLVDLSVEEMSRAWKNPLSEGGGRSA